MKVRAEVKGSDDLQAAINRILAAIEGPAVQQVLLDGADVMKSGVQRKIVEQGLVDKGGLLKHVYVRPVGRTYSEVELREGPLAYVFAQEFGLLNQVITTLQRAFFWAKWFKTQDSMWKALALSKTYTIPAKPHFRPGVDESGHEAAQVIAAGTERLIKEAL